MFDNVMDIDDLRLSFALIVVFCMSVILIGGAMLTRVEFFRGIIRKIEPNDPALMAFAILGMSVGLVLIGVHNTWAFHGRSFVTLACWVFLICCLSWIYAADTMANLIKKVFLCDAYYYVTIGITLFSIVLLLSGSYRFIRNSAELIGAAG